LAKQAEIVLTMLFNLGNLAIVVQFCRFQKEMILSEKIADFIMSETWINNENLL